MKYIGYKICKIYQDEFTGECIRVHDHDPDFHYYTVYGIRESNTDDALADCYNETLAGFILRALQLGDMRYV